MGVTGLWKLIEQSGKPVPLDTLENKVLAVDISIWLHQVVKGFQDSNGATLPNAHLLGLFHRLCKLLYYRIKPVFVFDGGVPPLKRETIAKRARNKSKYQNEADKLQQLLLESLAKEKVIQQALGPSTSALLINASPKKGLQKLPKDDEDDLFKLPPIAPDADSEKNSDESMTELTESDSSYDEKSRVQYSHSLQSIDVKSSYFQSLPADIRHEILSDIKETRKQSSWGRLHELPVESQSFSSFQMKRLLKRRQVQVELEEAEKEVGGKGLSMAELENLLSENGVVDPELATNRIASNEHVRFLHVRDVRKAMDKEAKELLKTEEVKNVEKFPAVSDVKKKLIEEEEEEDIDLQEAIQLSLGCAATDVEQAEKLNNSSETIQLTVEQRKALGSAATSLARNYMIEYGGLNDDQVCDLVKMDESVKSTSEFKFNDDSILNSKTDCDVDVKPAHMSTNSTEPINVEKTIEISDTSSDEGVSSDADSDFIDVPEVDKSDVDNRFFAQSKLPLPKPFLMNEPPSINEANDFRLKDLVPNAKNIEVVIKPTEFSNQNDIFADIFTISEQKHYEDIKTQIDCSEIVKPIVEIEKETIGLTEEKPAAPSHSMKTILDDLNREISTVTSLNLDNLLGPKTEGSEATEKVSIALETIVEKPTQFIDLKIFETKHIPPSEQTTPQKVPQPFFVKKTPPSSKKKSPQNTKTDTQDATPSKVSKSLLDTFEMIAPIPSTSTEAPINEQETVAMAANVLREQKSRHELEEIAAQLNQERVDLAAERNKKDRMGVSITEQMSMECMDLLRLFGVPYIVAPMEAEAQCAFLNEINLTDGTITDDSDIWLFGGKTVYKNFFDQNKLVMEFQSSNIKKLFHLDRPELIQLSFLVGSDYTQGIHGVGAVTALEVLSIFGTTPEKEGETTAMMSILSSLRKFRDWWQNKNFSQKTTALRSKLKNITLTEDFPNSRVVEAYLFPTVDENSEKFTWGHPEVESIREYAKKTFGWTNKRTDDIIIPVMKKLNEKASQQSIRNYFKITDVSSRRDLKVSKRVRIALEQMSADPSLPIQDSDTDEQKLVLAETKVVKKKSKRKTTKKTGGDGDTANKPAAETTKKKPSRKRKLANATDAEAIVEDFNVNEPSTSIAVATTTMGTKKIILPDNNCPIPQREKDKEIMESNKAKAVELLKKMKKTKN